MPNPFAASEDFGQLVHRTPERVCSPRTTRELTECVREAGRVMTRIAIRGQAHSVFGQSQVEGGWQLDLRGLRRIELHDDHAEVEAGCTWRDLVIAAAASGLAPAVLTDYCGLSIGGTLSMGGVGASSFVHGLQTDNVSALTVVTGRGDSIRCSPSCEPELFHNVRAGLGQIGVIASASIPLLHMSEMVEHWRIHHTSLEPCLLELAQLVEQGQFEQLSAVGTLDFAGVWSFHIDAVLPIDGEPDSTPYGGDARVERSRLSRLAYSTRLDAGMHAWDAAGLWRAPHPWVDVFVPAAALNEFAGETLAGLTPTTLGSEGAMILIYPLVARGATPRLALPTGELVYLFDVLRCVPGARPSLIDELMVENRRIHDQALAMGGCMYPIGAVDMSPTDWARHFGRGWSDFIAAKRRFDPGDLLGHGTPTCRA